MTARKLAVFAALAVATLPLAAHYSPHGALASSHREAPFTQADPEIDSTDLYAFRSPDRQDTITLVANYSPFEIAGLGPQFYRFGDDTLYAINIDNVGDGQPHIQYVFQFTTTFQSATSTDYETGPITRLDDPNLVIIQRYRLTRTDATGSTVVADNVLTPPANAGSKATPNYDQLAAKAITDLPGGGKVFAGQRADPFFIDFSVFDLLSIRKPPGNAGGGINGVAGFNILSLALQIPMAQLSNNGQAPTDPKGTNAIIGVWTTASLQSTSVLRPTIPGPADDGPFVQVSRLGQPLVNETLVPQIFKDKFNATQPANDAAYKALFDDPAPARALNAVYGIKVPPTPRDDITTIFALGIPGATMPAGGVPADELRLNMAVPVTAAPNRMGVLGKDLQGFPNGRRLTDDVVDIAFQALAGATYPLFHPAFVPDPLATQVGDGVDAPDRAPMANFPYLATPYTAH